MKGKLLLLVAWLLTFNAHAQPRSKPNVFIIFMDDMGYGDTEPYGMTGIPTPNFNRLTREGTRFTHFSAGQPVCTASRAALLTGRYPNRISMNGALLPGSKITLNPEEETIASLLKKVGYRTALLGKWHLGNRPPYFPIHYGFDRFYGLPYSHDIWPVDYNGHPISDHSTTRGAWPNLPIYEGDQKVDSILTLTDQSRLTNEFTKRAVSFIKANKDQPFFLYLAYVMPHVPLAGSVQGKK